ncbi:MAG: EAL domain-containing protein [Actinomycetota bacterium]|nr:EAL domain-containing protein [Actinomycetota bacterium]
MILACTSPPAILLVEDSETDALLVSAMLDDRAPGAIEVVRARSVLEATDELARREFLCVLLDLGLPDGGGLEALRAVLEARSAVPVVVVTGCDEETVGIDAIQGGAQDYLVKDHLDGAMLWRSVRYSVERKQVQEQLAHAALHDPLTGLPNRALLRDRLERALRRSQPRSSAVALLFVDIDRFKLINDTFGHAAGDRLLVLTAQRLVEAVRAGDTVARFGGDEFVVLLEGVSGEVDALGMAERLARATEQPVVVDGTELVVTLSTGIAVAAAGDGDGEDLLRRADTALYRAKQDGRSQSTVFAEWMRRRTSERLHIETSLRRAIHEGELQLHYQPIVDLDDGRTTAVEALVRWRHPARGVLYPAQFMPVAEETRLVVPMGEWVLREACDQVRRWRGECASAASLKVSVNLSGHQLARPEIVGVVADAITAARIDPSSLVLELTESVLMSDAEAAVRVLAALKELGVGLMVDDFGTGYSSLSYLKRFPVDALKIDRSFVAGVAENREDSAIVGAVVALAAALSLRTVAEGVETPAHLEKVRALGCSSAQGYYFARPQPAERVAALLGRGGAQVATPPAKGPTAVVCDDEPAIRQLYSRALERAGAVVTEVGDAVHCLALTERLTPDLVVLDVVLPGRSGTDILGELRRRWPDTLLVLVSGALPDDLAAQGRALGASECLQKMQFLPKIADLVSRCQEPRVARSTCPRATSNADA